MNHTFENYIGPRDCEFKKTREPEGVPINIAHFRRVQLKKVAESLNVDGSGPLNDLLKRVIVALRNIDAPENLDELKLPKKKKAA